MPVIAREEASDCSSPLLDVFIRNQGILVDVVELEWLIEDVTTGTPVQVEPATGRNTGNVAACPTGDRVSQGRYVAPFTIPVSFNLGVHRITWFFKQTIGGSEFSSQEEFEVFETSIPNGDELYATVQDIRDEGIPESQVSNLNVLKRINLASRYIDRVTGRFFTARTLEYFLDGSGHGTLFLQEPIIALSELEITLEGINFTDQPIDLDNIAVYNRHLSENLTRPDDRDNPKLVFKRLDPEFARLHGISGQSLFWKGKQNVRVSGIFGHTDNDGTATGKIPDLINHACKLLTIRNIAPLSDTDARSDALNAGNIRRLKTRDQEIEYQNRKLIGGSSEGPFTGDTEIDDILLMFLRPMDIATV